ncbi:MAG: MFS transporter [Chloroflexi bacterium]|nr:MFS transporter [Chloroflexota bacterium]
MAHDTTTIHGADAEQPAGENENTPKVTFITVLKNGSFRNLWLGQIVSQVGDYFAFLALLVVISGLSKDLQSTTLAVSGIMIASTLPRLLFGMLAGVFVDRWDRRRTMLTSDLLRAALTLAMIPAFLDKNLLALFALTFAMSAVGTLFNPAKGALIPKLVPKEQLLSANSLSQSSQMLAVLIGPALAGTTLKLAGTGNEWVAFLVDSLSFLISATAIFFISVPPEKASDTQPSASGPEKGAVRRVWEELLVGLKTLMLNRTVGTVTAILGITMLGMGAVNVLWIIYLKTRFGLEGAELAWRLSILDIAFAAGMIMSSVITGNVLSNLAPKWFCVGSLLGIGVMLAVFGYLPDYWTIAASIVLLGAFVAPINTGVSTLIQIVVPNEQLGRVNGGVGTVIDTATLGSMSLAGVLGAMLGIPVVFLIAGVICLLMGVTAWLVLPAITLKDKPEEDDTEQRELALHPEAILDPGLSLSEIEQAS